MGTTIKRIVTVREYAQITSESNIGVVSSMDLGVVSDETFQWLLNIHHDLGAHGRVLSIESQLYIRLGSYIGYLEAPNGEGIEILPKTEHIESTPIIELRQLLQKMLSVSLNLPKREAGAAQLRGEKQPLHEWIFQQFLCELNILLNKGLRFDYETVELDSLFVRGKLDFNKQIHQTPDKAMKFHIITSEFTPQRVENILIKTALCRLLRVTKNSENWKLANRFVHFMDEVKLSKSPLLDLQYWQRNRLLAYYQGIYPWCRLILEQFNPHFQKGLKQGIAFLFPMERLFENYVEYCLKTKVNHGLKLTTQKSTEYLVTHHPIDGSLEGKRKFQLRPDFVIESNLQSQSYLVLDTKWKIIDQTQEENNYGISQSDMYQLFAYGHKYLNGNGHLILIYPSHSKFDKPLAHFKLDESLYLWCIPFNLELGWFSSHHTNVIHAEASEIYSIILKYFKQIPLT